MEPISAFALTCNVLQVAEVSFKVIKLCKEIYQQGSLRENDEIFAMADELSTADSDLANQMAKSKFSARQLRIKNIALESKAMADDLMTILKELKFHKTQSHGRALIHAIRAIAKRRPIEKLQQRLKEQDRLLISVIIKEQFQRGEALEMLQSASFAKLGKVHKDLIQQHFDIQKRLDSHQSVLVKQNKRSEAHISSKVDDLGVNVRNERAYENFTKSFFFPEMMSRQTMVQERIPDYGDTYGWLFEPPALEGYQTDPGFFNWLQAQQHQGSGCFWITGKAGSGKSSLMNFIHQNLQAGKAGDLVLRDWDAGQSRIVLSHFFFQPATQPLQKSLEGYLRTMCYQILGSVTELQAIILQDHLAPTPVQLRVENPSASVPWLLHDLKHCFEYLLTKVTRTKPVFMIVDGLDEVVGDQDHVAIYLRTLDDTFRNLKICCSSRPEAHFQEIFSSDESLSLQYFNREDMEKYCHDQLDGTKADDLQQRIVNKAEGVFLWLYLVVKNLRRATRYADAKELEQLLEECPGDMFDLFNHMVQKADPYFKDTSTSYLALTYAHSNAVSSYPVSTQAGLSTSVFIIADKFDSELDEGILFGREVNLSLARKIVHACATGSQRVTALGCGLIEATGSTDDNSVFRPLFEDALEESDDNCDELLMGQLVSDCLQQWRFIHKSVREYLQDSYSSGNGSPLFSVSDLVMRTKIFRANLAMLRILVSLTPSLISLIMIQGDLHTRLFCAQQLLLYFEFEVEDLLNRGFDMSNMISLIEVGIETFSTIFNNAACLRAVPTGTDETLGEDMLEAVHMGLWIKDGLSLQMQLRTLAARIPILSDYIFQNSLDLPSHLRSQLFLLAFAQLVGNRDRNGRRREGMAHDIRETAIRYLERIEDMKEQVCLISSTQDALMADEGVKTTVQDIILTYVLNQLCWRQGPWFASRAQAGDIIKCLINNGARDDVKFHFHLMEWQPVAFEPVRSRNSMLIAHSVKACLRKTPCIEIECYIPTLEGLWEQLDPDVSEPSLEGVLQLRVIRVWTHGVPKYLEPSANEQVDLVEQFTQLFKYNAAFQASIAHRYSLNQRVGTAISRCVKEMVEQRTHDYLPAELSLHIRLADKDDSDSSINLDEFRKFMNLYGSKA